MLSIFPNDLKDFDVHVVSDKTFDFTGNLTVTVLTFEGKVISENTITNYKVADSSSSVAYTVPSKVLAGTDLNSTFIRAVFIHGLD
jgi:Mannosidase Ig/CBM-like domain